MNFSFNKLFSGFLLLMCVITKTQASVIDLETLDSSLQNFSCKRYNELKTVEEANNLLQQASNFSQFIEEAKSLAAAYEVSEFFGVRLAHKHTELLPNMIMVDNYEEWMDQKALVTRPIEQKSSNDAIPSSWILGKKGLSYKVFEYSTDPTVKKNFEILKAKPQIFEDFYNIAKSYNLEKILVPSILSREWEKELSKNGYTFYLEQSYQNPSFKSIITAQKEEDFKKVTVQPIITGWDLLKEPFTTFVCTLTRYCADYGGTHNSNAYYHQVSNN